MEYIKKILYLILIFSLLSYSSVFSIGTLQENENYLKGEELLEKAKEEYDAGNYDKGKEHSEEAKKFFEIAYAEFNISKLIDEINKYKELTEQRLEKAEELNVQESKDQYVLELYDKAKAAYDEASLSYDSAEACEDPGEKTELYKSTKDLFEDSARNAGLLLAELEPNPNRDDANKLLKEAFAKRENIIEKEVINEGDEDDNNIMDSLNQSSDYYIAQEYDQSKDFSKNAISYMDQLLKDFQNKDKADMKLKEAFEKRSSLLEKSIIEENDNDDTKIVEVLDQSSADFEGKKYSESIEKSEYAMDLMDMIINKDKFKAEAEQMLKKAEAALTDASNKNDADQNADLINKARGVYDDAVAAYDNEIYNDSIDLSIKVINMLSAISPALPKYYRVRLIPDNRDCLWKIAEYYFVYQDRNQWQIIYERNKEVFKEPDNPHLIYPGQVFEIPSLKGERRDDTYNPEKEYPKFKDIVK